MYCGVKALGMANRAACAVGDPNGELISSTAWRGSWRAGRDRVVGVEAVKLGYTGDGWAAARAFQRAQRGAVAGCRRAEIVSSSGRRLVLWNAAMRQPPSPRTRV